MAITNYKTANNVSVVFAAGIDSVTTSLPVETGKGDLFPSVFPYKATLEETDANSNIIKREIVDVTNRVWDILTISRATESCPQSYTATTQTANALDFTAWAFVSLRITAIEMDGLHNEVVTDDNTTNIVHKTGTETITWDKTHTGDLIIDVDKGKTSSISAPTLDESLVNKKYVDDQVSLAATPASTGKLYVAWEDVVAWDALYVDTTTWEVFKTDATDQNKRNFVWFANSAALTWANVLVNKTYDDNQSGLTIWETYYLSWFIEGATWNLETTPVVPFTSNVNSTSYDVWMVDFNQFWGLTNVKITDIEMALFRNWNPTGNIRAIVSGKVAPTLSLNEWTLSDNSIASATIGNSSPYSTYSFNFASTTPIVGNGNCYFWFYHDQPNGTTNRISLWGTASWGTIYQRRINLTDTWSNTASWIRAYIKVDYIDLDTGIAWTISSAPKPLWVEEIPLSLQIVPVWLADSATSIDVTNPKQGGWIARGTTIGAATVTTWFYPTQVIYSDTINTQCFLDEENISNKTQTWFDIDWAYDWVARG